MVDTRQKRDYDIGGAKSKEGFVMTYVIKNLFKRLFAWILALIATLTTGPVIPEPSGEVADAPYLFDSEQAY